MSHSKKPKKSAIDANTLFKVSEFGTIEEATDAMISMSQAYKELKKSEINDILNNVGNNFSISTEGLANCLTDIGCGFESGRQRYQWKLSA